MFLDYTNPKIFVSVNAIALINIKIVEPRKKQLKDKFCMIQKEFYNFI